MKVVVFAPTSGHDDALLPAGHDVVVVSWADESGPGLIGLRRSSRWDRIVRALSTTPLTRAILTITPLDRGAVYMRATARDPRVLDAARGADLFIATERDGCFAAWQWQRRARRHGRAAPAALGYPAGRALLESLAR